MPVHGITGDEVPFAARLWVTSAGPGTERVYLDGVDISAACAAVTVTIRAGEPGRAVLELPVVEGLDVDDVPCEVHLSPATRDLLLRHGWTPPTPPPV